MPYVVFGIVIGLCLWANWEAIADQVQTWTKAMDAFRDKD